MAKPVEFQFQPTPADYARAAAFFYRRRAFFWVLLALLGVFFVLFLLTLLLHPSPLSDVSLFILFGLLCFAFLVGSMLLAPFRLSRQAAKNKALMSQLKWVATDDGLEVSSSETKSILPWNAFSGYIEGEESFLLLAAANPSSFQPIPRRAFQNEDDLAAFQSMLQFHLKKK